MAKYSEKEVAEKVVKYLKELGFNVYQEVECNSGYADIVAEKNGILWCVETKTSLSDQLLDQAIARTKSFHYVSVATPSDARLSYSKEIVMKKYGIGLLSMRHGVSQAIAPKLYRHTTAARESLIKNVKKLKLVPEQQLDIAGSQSGEQLTSFKLTLLRVARELQKKGPMPLVNLVKEMDKGLYHYRTPTALKSAILRGMAGGYILEFKIKDQNIYLTKAGEELIEKYKV